jgi:chromate reductase, NAD(P)H dehydrogenase (quinone)
MPRILGISGSLRCGSYNTALLNAAVPLVETGTEFEIASIRGIPAIDWMSRPSTDIPKVFGNRPVAVIGASPGPYGTVLAQNAWLPTLRTLRARPWFGGRLLVSRASHVFNDAGELIDEAVRNQLREFLRGFAHFIQTSGPPQEQARV